MRVSEPGLEGEDRARKREDGEQTPVDLLEFGVTVKSVVDEWDRGTPHEKQDTLEVELDADVEHA